MVQFIENPITQSLLENCTQALNNASQVQAIQEGIISDKNTTILLWVAILGVFLVIWGFRKLYLIGREHFAYKIGILYLDKLLFYYKWRLEGKVTIKHSRKDKFTYIVHNSAIKGNTIIFSYHNPEPMDFKEVNATITGLNFDTLNKSTVIEKIITADDFMNLIKVLLILIIIGIVVSLVISFMSYGKDVSCDLIVNNVSILRGYANG